MKTNNEQIKVLQEAIELNNQLIKQAEDEVFKNTKEINWLAKKNVDRLQLRNRLVNEVEKLEKELDEYSG
jgi:hypothetical protein